MGAAKVRDRSPPHLKDYLLKLWTETEIRRLGPTVSTPLNAKSKAEREALLKTEAERDRPDYGK